VDVLASAFLHPQTMTLFFMATLKKKLFHAKSSRKLITAGKYRTGTAPKKNLNT
jgi:hypothetical protein